MTFATGDRLPPRWIIHLPTTLTSLDEVTALAVALRDSLGHLSVLDFGETTLSEEDAQFLRTRVFCDAKLDGTGRCRRPDAHGGPCAAMIDSTLWKSGCPQHTDTPTSAKAW
ncbi:hypothetical protein [Micromonospora sp. WMMD710]|uniref:hypothetical protein n=1 Tax=Micromonospora sp. WMMD710 TaxID=3016085 RepID=UPI002415DF28|nr:hypothetical protein [Micromonospora sp. WMMD710]MDG4759544.1 hypothetical protein [Micromonospora sp. WMMD710]